MYSNYIDCVYIVTLIERAMYYNILYSMLLYGETLKQLDLLRSLQDNTLFFFQVQMLSEHAWSLVELGTSVLGWSLLVIHPSDLHNSWRASLYNAPVERRYNLQSFTSVTFWAGVSTSWGTQEFPESDIDVFWCSLSNQSTSLVYGHVNLVNSCVT